jgi:hypothetical protein
LTNPSIAHVDASTEAATVGPAGDHALLSASLVGRVTTGTEVSRPVTCRGIADRALTIAGLSLYRKVPFHGISAKTTR